MPTHVTRQPEIIAHRGVPREARENTLASFRLAIEQGADGIELDVHMTRDGVVVVHHDAIVRVVDGADAWSQRRIADVDANTILDPGQPDGGRLPTLDAVLSLVQDRATVYVEAKAAGLAAQLVACFDCFPKVRVAVHSFDHRIPVAVRDLQPAIPIGLLSSSYSLSLTSYLSLARPHAYWQSAELIDESLVREAHACGSRVIAWTVNDAVHARALLAMGVDGLCTDVPGLLRTQLLGIAP